MIWHAPPIRAREIVEVTGDDSSFDRDRLPSLRTHGCELRT